MTGLPDLVVSTTDPTPPYEQLRRQLAALIVAGLLPPGVRLPPLRQLAGDLGLAVGTVARTYRELETAGLIISRRGGGTRVAAQSPAPGVPPATAPGPAADARFVPPPTDSGQAATDAGPVSQALRRAADQYLRYARTLGVDEVAAIAAIHDVAATSYDGRCSP